MPWRALSERMFKNISNIMFKVRSRRRFHCHRAQRRAELPNVVGNLPPGSRNGVRRHHRPDGTTDNHHRDLETRILERKRLHTLNRDRPHGTHTVGLRNSDKRAPCSPAKTWPRIMAPMRSNTVRAATSPPACHAEHGTSSSPSALSLRRAMVSRTSYNPSAYEGASQIPPHAG